MLLADRGCARRIEAAGFAGEKSLEDFAYEANPVISPATIHTLTERGWIEIWQPLCLIGDSGTGESWLLLGLWLRRPT